MLLSAQEVGVQDTGAARGASELSIVIVTRDNLEYLEPCLESIYRDPPHRGFVVVLIDNGSTDDSLARVRGRFPAVQIIENRANVGLSAASNQGIRATETEYVLLLNDDTVVNWPSLDALVEFLDRNPDVGAVGGRLLNADGTTQSCYNRFSSLKEELLIATRLGELLWKGYPAVMRDDEVRDVDWIGSACLLLRRKALAEVGLLDEQYFIYGDEVDLQFRLRRAGWRISYIPEARTVHFGGRSMDRWKRRKMVYRGKLLFYQKNYGWWRAWLLRAMFASLSVAKVMLWAPAILHPRTRRRARLEVVSNLDVVRVCGWLR